MNEMTMQPNYTHYMPTGKILSGKLKRNNPTDAGQDIYSNEGMVIRGRSSASVGTGLVIAVPKGHVGLVWPRSGSSFKSDIETGAGVIDADYRGEVRVKLYNHGDDDFIIEPDERIAQLLTIPINTNNYIKVDELDETTRGTNGFGQSGTK